jgi:hypothetical protein
VSYLFPDNLSHGPRAPGSPRSRATLRVSASRAPSPGHSVPRCCAIVHLVHLPCRADGPPRSRVPQVHTGGLVTFAHVGGPDEGIEGDRHPWFRRSQIRQTEREVACVNDSAPEIRLGWPNVPGDSAQLRLGTEPVSVIGEENSSTNSATKRSRTTQSVYS